MKLLLALLLVSSPSVAQSVSETALSRCHDVLPKLAIMNMEPVAVADLAEFKQAASDCAHRFSESLSKRDLIFALDTVLHIDAELGRRSDIAAKKMDSVFLDTLADCDKGLKK